MFNFFHNFRFPCRAILLALSVSLFLHTSPANAREVQAKTQLLRNSEFVDTLLDTIDRAKSSIVMTYFLFKATEKRGNLPAKVVDALLDASRRGVKVSLLLEQSNEERDSLNRDNHQTAKQLRRGGVKVLFDDPRRTTHVKSTVIDERYVFIGSHNLTHSALSRNNELSVLIDSPELAKETTTYLLGL
jgi:phosphatidylserine/phosphatidylglycerophosphate/cardiolipin synthase-like enzyme